ncbi:MAG: hypothetical protein U0P81_02510 [Holophagaceae bacterium]
MPRVAFTANLQRHLACPPVDVPGATVREALEAVFAKNPRLRGYVLDEHGALRFHVAIFLDGTPIRDRMAQGDAAGEQSQIYVMQALSGG